jgi:hypothetical protein
LIQNLVVYLDRHHFVRARKFRESPLFETLIVTQTDPDATATCGVIGLQ